MRIEYKNKPGVLILNRIMDSTKDVAPITIESIKVTKQEYEDLLELADELNYAVDKESPVGWRAGPCPLCAEELRPSSVNRDIYLCVNCSYQEKESKITKELMFILGSPSTSLAIKIEIEEPTYSAGFVFELEKGDTTTTGYWASTRDWGPVRRHASSQPKTPIVKQHKSLPTTQLTKPYFPVSAIDSTDGDRTEARRCSCGVCRAARALSDSKDKNREEAPAVCGTTDSK